MFSRVDFREDEGGRQKKKNQQQQLLFGECLAGRGREENDSGVHVLSLWAHQKVLSPKWGENWVGGVW